MHNLSLQLVHAKHRDTVFDGHKMKDLFGLWERRNMTVKELKSLLAGKDDNALVLYQDPYSEYSFEVVYGEDGLTKLSHTSHDGNKFYDSFTKRDFDRMCLEDVITGEESVEIISEYSPSFLLQIAL
jgi:hypothetical protein